MLSSMLMTEDIKSHPFGYAMTRTALSLLSLWLLFIAVGSRAQGPLPPHLADWAANNPIIYYSHSFGLHPDDFIDDLGQPSGFAYDLYRALGEVLPVRFVPKETLTWPQQMEALTQETIDIVAICAKTEIRQAKFHFSKPIIEQRPGFLIHQDNPHLVEVRNWSHAHVMGYISGTALRHYLESYDHNATTVITSGYENGIVQVASGDLDIFLVYQSTASYWAAVNRFTRLQFVPFSNVEPEVNFMCVRQGAPELAELIDWGLSQLGETQFNQLKQKWYSNELSIADSLLESKDQDADASQRKVRLNLYIYGMFAILSVVIFIFARRIYLSSDLADFFGQSHSRRHFAAIVVLICGGFIFAIVLALHSFKESAYETYHEQLDIAQDGVESLLHEWFSEKKTQVNLTISEKLSILTQVLIELAQVGGNGENQAYANHGLLRESPVTRELRNYVSQRINLGPTTGFFIIGPDNINLGSMRDANLGEINLLATQAPQYLDKAWAGETVLVPPVESDVHFETFTDQTQAAPHHVYSCSHSRPRWAYYWCLCLALGSQSRLLQYFRCL